MAASSSSANDGSGMGGGAGGGAGGAGRAGGADGGAKVGQYLNDPSFELAVYLTKECLDESAKYVLGSQCLLEYSQSLYFNY